jgi:hypothetical protein
MKQRILSMCVLAGATGITPGLALSSDLRIDGFANIVAGQMISDTDDGSLYGYDEDLSFSPETNYGIQFRSDLQEGLSVTAQIVGRGREDYDAKVTWAYLTYEINDELSIKAGRSRVPYFMYSDFLDIGYAYHWIRPPQSVYGLGFENADGLTLEHLTDIGDWTSRVTLMAGRLDSDSDLDGTVVRLRILNQVGGAWSMSYDWFTARIAYFTSRVDIPSEDLAALSDGISDYDAGLALAVPGYEEGTLDEFADKVVFNEDQAQFAGIGFSADYNNLIAVAEYTQIRIDDSPLEDRDSWYMSAGYRINQFTVFGTYEKYNFNAKTDEVEKFANAAPITGVPALDGARAGILAGLPDVFSGEQDAEGMGIGVRYNFHPSAAIKIEYNQLDNKTTDTKPQSIAIATNIVF